MRVICILVILILIFIGFIIYKKIKINNEILISIKNSPDVIERTKVYKKTKIFLSWANNRNINIFAREGFLLGAIRHKGYIPWDCDTDLAILEEDLPHLLSYKKEKGVNINLDNWNTWGHIKFFPDGVKMTSANIKIPNSSASITVLGSTNLHGIKGHYYYGDAKQLKRWGAIPTKTNIDKGGRHAFFFIPITDHKPFKKQEWYDISILVPNNSEKILKMCYGENCLKVAINKCAEIQEDNNASIEETNHLRSICKSINIYGNWENYGKKMPANKLKRGIII